jgi:hypothetical protein
VVRVAVPGANPDVDTPSDLETLAAASAAATMPGPAGTLNAVLLPTEALE